MSKKIQKSWLLLSSVLLLVFATSGCGKQQFEVVTTTQALSAPGHFMVPPKVDIVLGEDDSGSIKEIYSTISQEVPRFLNGLQNKGWDYHFATAPLTTDRPMDQVVGSAYDGNWGSQWKAPYPGANQFDPLSLITASVFRFPEQYTGFLSYYQTSNANNSIEPGFETLRKALYNRAPGTGFLRSDALLVVLVVGNGNDTSGVTYCDDVGFSFPYENLLVPNPTHCFKDGVPSAPVGTADSSFNYYKSQFQGLRPQPSQVQFHAAVSPGGTCLGGPSFAGGRYQQMAISTGGQTYNICTQSVVSVLDSLSNNLQAQKLAMRTRYVFLSQPPETSSIKVTKYVGGNASQAVVLPQNATNGWTYAGWVGNVYAIDAPILMNLSSGYAIELHGSAKLSGNDTADVSYLPQGAHNSQ